MEQSEKRIEVRGSQVRQQPAGEREFVYCPLGQDRGARILFRGEPTQGDIDDLVAYLNIAKRRLPKDGETPPGEE